MNETASRIYHVTEQSALDAVTDGQYTCESLAQEGFIHCCTQYQLEGVLERYYQGASGLKQLEIDTEKLVARLVFENTVGGDELFPHVYGKINMDAVVSVSDID